METSSNRTQGRRAARAARRAALHDRELRELERVRQFVARGPYERSGS